MEHMESRVQEPHASCIHLPRRMHGKQEQVKFHTRPPGVCVHASVSDCSAEQIIGSCEQQSAPVLLFFGTFFLQKYTDKKT